MKINYSLTSLEYTFNQLIGFESIEQGQQGQINVISFKPWCLTPVGLQDCSDYLENLEFK